MKASMLNYLANIKRTAFSSSVFNPRALNANILTRQITPFRTALAGFLGFKALDAAGSVLGKKGNIALYRGLYTSPGENVMSSGRRGIDARIPSNTGLVNGLHSNRRKY